MDKWIGGGGGGGEVRPNSIKIYIRDVASRHVTMLTIKMMEIHGWMEFFERMFVSLRALRINLVVVHSGYLLRDLLFDYLFQYSRLHTHSQIHFLAIKAVVVVSVQLKKWEEFEPTAQHPLPLSHSLDSHSGRGRPSFEVSRDMLEYSAAVF